MRGVDPYCVVCKCQQLCKAQKLGKCEIIAETWPVKPRLTYNKRLKLAEKGGFNLRRWLK